MKRTIGGPITLLALLCANINAQVDSRTLDGKVLFGYQGWFNCEGDGAPENNWRSWARGAPSPETLTIDMYPDLTEFAPADLCAVPGMTIRGKQAYLYSAWNPKIVSAHFRWIERVRARRRPGAAIRDHSSAQTSVG